jgi:hypothetical protein
MRAAGDGIENESGLRAGDGPVVSAFASFDPQTPESFIQLHRHVQPDLHAAHAHQCLEALHVVIGEKKLSGKVVVLLHVPHGQDKHEVPLARDVVALLDLRTQFEGPLHRVQQIDLFAFDFYRCHDSKREAYFLRRNDGRVPVYHAVVGQASQTAIDRGGRQIYPGTQFVLRDMSVALDFGQQLAILSR